MNSRRTYSSLIFLALLIPVGLNVAGIALGHEGVRKAGAWAGIPALAFVVVNIFAGIFRRPVTWTSIRKDDPDALKKLEGLEAEKRRERGDGN